MMLEWLRKKKRPSVLYYTTEPLRSSLSARWWLPCWWRPCFAAGRRLLPFQGFLSSPHPYSHHLIPTSQTRVGPSKTVQRANGARGEIVWIGVLPTSHPVSQPAQLSQPHATTPFSHTRMYSHVPLIRKACKKHSDPPSPTHE